jgi:glycosyltransferase involved in cell wall biosynthesis
MAKIKALSIVMPAYNEEQVIRRVVNSVKRAISSLGIEYEIIIVNDASLDRTGEIATEIAQNAPKIKVIHHLQNKMMGGAIKTGARAAQYDYILPIPFDSPLNKPEIENFLKEAEEVDIVIGYRPERTGYNWFLKLLSGGLKNIFRILFRINLKDFTWICLYKKEVFEKLSLNFNGVVFFPEILIKSIKKGYSVKEIPSAMKKREYGKGTVSRPLAMVKILADVFKLWGDVYLKKNIERRKC